MQKLEAVVEVVSLDSWCGKGSWWRGRGGGVEQAGLRGSATGTGGWMGKGHVLRYFLFALWCESERDDVGCFFVEFWFGGLLAVVPYARTPCAKQFSAPAIATMSDHKSPALLPQQLRLAIA